ncbi:MAG: hypothetical protein M1826_002618 [Phylliscum demangeonii]|nr:MAG: hypothetical protein M1826_002618 [Phylliscum demangeonii]
MPTALLSSGRGPGGSEEELSFSAYDPLLLHGDFLTGALMSAQGDHPVAMSGQMPNFSQTLTSSPGSGFGAGLAMAFTGEAASQDPMLNTPSPGQLRWPDSAADAGLDFSPEATAGEESIGQYDQPATRAAPAMVHSDGAVGSMLIAQPMATKSRVETQIPVKLTFRPLASAVTKLHLPPYSISKPKLMANPSPPRSPNMLELDAVVVCSSAMLEPENLQRAFARAATYVPRDVDPARRQISGDPVMDEEDERQPLKGGDVTICERCIERERKRLCRKKNREEQADSWARDERLRVVVFNTQEVKEWQRLPASGIATPSEAGPPSTYLPDTAMQIELPMRIACYCRHHQEKIGYRVIFTLKDHNDRLVAQAITDSIMITDDHKTHGVPSSQDKSRPPSAADGSASARGMPSAGAHAAEHALGPPPNPLLGAEFPDDVQPAHFRGPPFPVPWAERTPVRLSHSSSDLLSLHGHTPAAYSPPGASRGSHGHAHSASVSTTPRNLSRQASFSGPSGPASKRRKSTTFGRLPETLTMTRLDTAAAQAGLRSASTATSPSSAGLGGPMTGLSPFSPVEQYSAPSARGRRSQLATSASSASASGSGSGRGYAPHAYGPRAAESLLIQQAFSAPTSALHSRAPSPTNSRASGMPAWTMPAATGPPPPCILKVLPGHGPKSGGVEVSCVGRGFYQGLEVVFGDRLATTTTFWSESLLVCVLPPAAAAGEVFVRFQHEFQPQGMPVDVGAFFAGPNFAVFRYVDEHEEQLMRTALSVLGHKLTGRMVDPADMAHKILTGALGM